MARVQFALTLVAIIFVTLEAVTALQCHNCYYKKYGNEEDGNKHCEKGGLKKLWLTGCNGGKDSVFGCGKVAVKDGKLNDGYGNATVEYGVYRGCASLTKDATTSDGCVEKPLSEWRQGKDDWSMWVTSRAADTMDFNEGTRVEACYCKDDECNAATDLTASISVLGMVAASAIAAALKF